MCACGACSNGNPNLFALSGGWWSRGGGDPGVGVFGEPNKRTPVPPTKVLNPQPCKIYFIANDEYFSVDGSKLFIIAVISFTEIL